MRLYEAWKIFDGVMMSDGCLIPSSPTNSVFQVQLSGSEHMDWLVLINSALGVLGVGCGSPKVYPVECGERQRDNCRLCSKASSFLGVQRLRWYSNGAKRIPEDFRLDSISLANEFMGDGNSYYNHGRSSSGVTIRLSTVSYDLTSIGKIEEQLKEIGIAHLSRILYSNCSRAKGASGISINILGASAERFISLVEPYIVPSFKYKVKKPGSRSRFKVSL